MSSYQEAIMNTEGIAAYWPLQDGAGASTALELVTENNGTVLGAVDPGTPGMGTNTAFDFRNKDASDLAQAVDPVVEMPVSNVNALTTFSCIFWVYIKEHGNTYTSLVNCAQFTKALMGWRVRGTPGGLVEFQMWDGAVFQTVSKPITTDAWHMIAATHTGASQKIYIDGGGPTTNGGASLVSNTTQPMTFGSEVPVAGPALPPYSPYAPPTAPFNYGNKQLCHVSIFDRQVGAEEQTIFYLLGQALLNDGGPAAGTIRLGLNTKPRPVITANLALQTAKKASATLAMITVQTEGSFRGETTTAGLAALIPPAQVGDHVVNTTLVEEQVWDGISWETTSLRENQSAWRDFPTTIQRLHLNMPISPVQITANQNNYSPIGLHYTSSMRLSTDASRNITGIASSPVDSIGGTNGRLLLINNIGAFPVVLKNQDAASTAANRFALPSGLDITIVAGGSTALIYDKSASRWRSATESVSPGSVTPHAPTHQADGTDILTWKHKSGAGVTIADGDYTATPPNGTMASTHNTTNGRSYIWLRANGAWKSVQVL